MRRYPGLHHLAAGAVSISLNGEEVAITLAKALSLDSSHQARAHGSTTRGLALIYHTCATGTLGGRSYSAGMYASVHQLWWASVPRCNAHLSSMLRR